MDTPGFYLRAAGLLGALAVVSGAFGAHASKSLMGPEMAQVYETAVRYHIYHTLAIVAVTALAARLSCATWWQWACRAWLTGIVLFSGSLYLRVLADLDWLAAVTPVGGGALIIGWLSLAAAAGGYAGRAGE
ncbi:MAG: DUF423 domain-containing protein [Gammaproteobacteria bacterium]|nr:DUF423 domain-containing protein [Gammaproteobacteria bacterium]NIM74188.1 DUF423 domain-containing protein [Gammaproteobacteria bacterium]NIN39487.1 DUF423 domain-containing protein [Gammaproteobacteria bacterium]NIO25960.1 DUF423 domain-containing protein [Gammaproteobacteria bacterium]NIO66593.1 DUF423 domain-containing protein [Gammaproteobacteria bacterium]